MITVRVLGPGCAKCNKLYELVQACIDEEGIDAELFKVEDLDMIIDYGVAFTPGLVVNEQVVSSGKVPSRKQIMSWLRDAS